MKISSKAKYAVNAMLELASRPNEYISVSELSTRRDIPQTFLEQLLLSMKRAKLTRSRRGPDGGYTLALPPDEIYLVDIYQSVEGPLNLCPAKRPADMGDAAEGLWLGLEQTISDFLGGITLADLLMKTQRFPDPMTLAHSYTFSI
ncbi:MAG: Rrf2 family transcriptional regulator [Candidatus Poribacteria bacterium]|nr:Rrf2 family transcriptional regulator [Candidatus Poribacteria bacterium]